MASPTSDATTATTTSSSSTTTTTTSSSSTTTTPSSSSSCTTTTTPPSPNGLSSSKYALANPAIEAPIPPAPLPGLAASKWSSSAPTRPRQSPSPTFPRAPQPSTPRKDSPPTANGLPSSRYAPASSPRSEAVTSTPTPPVDHPPQSGLAASKWASSAPTKPRQAQNATCPLPSSKSQEDSSSPLHHPATTAASAPAAHHKRKPVTPYLPFGGIGASKWAH